MTDLIMRTLSVHRQGSLIIEFDSLGVALASTSAPALHAVNVSQVHDLKLEVRRYKIRFGLGINAERRRTAEVLRGMIS